MFVSPEAKAVFKVVGVGMVGPGPSEEDLRVAGQALFEVGFDFS